MSMGGAEAMDRATNTLGSGTGGGPVHSKSLLIAPVVALLVVGVAVASIVIVLAARHLDERAVATSERLAFSALASHRRAIAKLAFDYSWWDELPANIIDTYNSAWADDNIGSYLTETFDIDYAFVIGADDRVVAAFVDGEEIPEPATLKDKPWPLEALVARARAAPMAKPEPQSIFAVNNGQAYVVAANAVTAENPVGSQLRRHARPVLVLAKALDPELLATTAQDFLLDDLRIVIGMGKPSLPAMALQGIDGAQLATLTWRPEMPGRDLLRSMLPVLFITFLVMGLLVVMFLRRARSTWREQAELETQLALEIDARRHAADLAHLQRVNTLGETTTAVAHELNQPLSVISSYIQGCIERLRLGDNESESLLTALEAAANQAKRADGIIRRIRVFARNEEPAPAVIDINELIREAVSLMRADLHEHEVIVSLELANGLPSTFANPVQVQQVVVNLLRNGIDALASIPQDQRCITVRTESSGSDMIEIEVSDTGPGVAPEVRDQLFMAFFSSKADGLGMGLAISHSIVEAQGGQLSLTESRGGNQGATFRFTLPVHAESSTHAA